MALSKIIHNFIPFNFICNLYPETYIYIVIEHIYLIYTHIYIHNTHTYVEYPNL